MSAHTEDKKKNTSGEPKLRNLLKYGYFPQELPPVFTTEHFGDVKSLSALRKSSDFESEPIFFSIPRKSMSRRRLSIPNPAQYLDLCTTITRRYKELKKFIISKNSATAPEFPLKPHTGLRPVQPRESYPEFILSCFNLSHGMSFGVSVDISRFYSTIYTHIIPWVIHGRAVAKKERRGSLLGNELDRKLRSLRGGQTLGIPIGPDASHIISEIICTEVDSILRKKFPDLRFRRYRDDYRFYVPTRSRAEEVLRAMESILSDLLLEMNDQKTVIEEVPFVLEPEWIFNLRRFTFDKNPKKQRNDLVSFFSIVLKYIRQYPDAGVTRYAMAVLSNLKVADTNVDLHVSLLFRLLSTSSSCFREFADILLKNKGRISIKILKREIEVLLGKHVPHQNNYEIAWCLWLCKVFTIKVKNTYAARILASNDPMAILMLYDLRDDGLLSKTVTFKRIDALVRDSGFEGDWWLLKYETLRRKWVKNQKNVSNPFFTDLRNQDVAFYDSGAIYLGQVRTLTWKRLAALYANLGLPYEG